MNYPTALEERPGVDGEKIQRRRGLVPDRRNGEPPYGVGEHIRRVIDVGLLDSKTISAVPVGEGDMTAVRVRGCSLRIATYTGGWRVQWKHWTNIPQIYVIDVRVDLFWARQPQEHANLTYMYDVMSQIRDKTLQAGADSGRDVRILGNISDFIVSNQDTERQATAKWNNAFVTRIDLR